MFTQRQVSLVVLLGCTFPIAINAQSEPDRQEFATSTDVVEIKGITPTVTPPTPKSFALLSQAATVRRAPSSDTVSPRTEMVPSLTKVTPPSLSIESFNPPHLLAQKSQEPEIANVEIEGNTVLEAEIQEIIAPLIGLTASLQELDNTANAIYELYFNNGYLTTTAQWEYQIETKTLVIHVMEGRVSEIKVEGTDRLVGYVRSRIARGTGTPLNTAELEEQLRLLSEDPLFDDVSGSIRRGEEPGESIVIVRVEEANPLSGRFQIDNYSAPAIGAERLSLDLIYRNLTGTGDSVTASYRPRTAAFTDTWRLELGYQIPVNSLNGTIAWSSLIDRNLVIQDPFEGLDVRGESERHQLTYRQPVIRNLNQELAFSMGFNYFDQQTFILNEPTPFTIGPDGEGRSRTRSIDLGQDYTHRDDSGTWGLRSLFRFGLDVFDATTNSGSIPDGQFFVWLGQFQRLQVINDNNFLIAELDVQLTPNALLPSDQFVIGGGDSVRGYRQNLLSGDNGLRFSVEDRIILVRNNAGIPQVQLAPFLDMGTVWNTADNPNRIFEGQHFIIGLGLGVLWQPVEGLNLRVDYAPPLIEVDTRGNNLQNDGLYFSAGYYF